MGASNTTDGVGEQHGPPQSVMSSLARPIRAACKSKCIEFKGGKIYELGQEPSTSLSYALSLITDQIMAFRLSMNSVSRHKIYRRVWPASKPGMGVCSVDY